MSTTITGLASGIQWKDTIDLLMQIKRQPIDRLQARMDEADRKKGAWSSIQAKLEALQSASNRIDTRTELLKKTATSTDTTQVSVSADADAVSATHTVIVNQLAQAEVEVHSGWADIGTTPVKTGSAGQFDYSFAGTNYSVTVPAGTKLNELVQLINNDVNNPGIVASTIDDGGGSDPVHLVLSSKEPGSSNTIAVLDTTDLGSTGTEFDSGTFTETQTAQDSEIRVDGYPPASWIVRESNNIDDVIEGLTLTLKDTTDASGIEITISTDDASIKQNIKDWVNSYNDVMDTIATLTRYDSENKIQGVLMNDSQVFRVRSNLQEIATNEIPGIRDNATYNNLSSIGIKSGTDNKLTVDDSDLSDALDADIDSVVELFIFSHSSTDQALQYFAKTEATDGGNYQVTATYLANGKLDANGTNTIGGYEATVEGIITWWVRKELLSKVYGSSLQTRVGVHLL